MNRSVFLSNRNLLFIEDILVRFEDDSKIENVLVNIEYQSFVIEFGITDSVIGYDKLKLYDDIISILKRKFDNILILGGKIVVDLRRIRIDKCYIERPLTNEYNSLIGRYFYKLLRKRNYIFNRRVINYEYDDKILFDYNTKTKHLYIHDYILDRFRYNSYSLQNYDITNRVKGLLNESDIKFIFGSYFSKHYSVEVLTINSSTYNKLIYAMDLVPEPGFTQAHIS